VEPEVTKAEPAKTVEVSLPKVVVPPQTQPQPQAAPAQAEAPEAASAAPEENGEEEEEEGDEGEGASEHQFKAPTVKGMQINYKDGKVTFIFIRLRIHLGAQQQLLVEGHTF
jgi:hypothetical protein